MKIFVDLHHQALANSLQLLLEKRLGHQIFFPYGMDWFHKGYWHIGDPYGASARNTAIQFLKGALPADGTGRVTVPNKMTFDEFCATKIDVVIASYQGNIKPYQRLIEKHQPGAKLIAHYGNAWDAVDGVKNYMISTAPIPLPAEANKVFYHQEFDTALFAPVEAVATCTVTSMTNAIRQSSIYKKDWEDFLLLETLLPDYIFRSFGGGCRDESLHYPDEVAQAMQLSEWGFHLKAGGDGYGHVIHNWAAVGRPLIYRGSQYRGKLAEVFLTHLVTGIDLDRVSLRNAATMIDTLDSDKMGHNIHARFKELVNFETEAKQVELFLERLK